MTLSFTTPRRFSPAHKENPIPSIDLYDVSSSFVSSSFAMEQIKYTTALPVDYARQRDDGS